MLLQGALRLLLVCILGLQGTLGDSWDTREVLTFASSHRLPPRTSSPAGLLAAWEHYKALHIEAVLEWREALVQWSALKTATAGHQLPPPPMLPPPPLPPPRPQLLVESSAALRSQDSKALREWEQQAAGTVHALASSRKLLQRLNFENPNYHPSPPPPIPPPPPSPPPSPPSPPAQTGTGTVPWQGTLQGITSALGALLFPNLCKIMTPSGEPCTQRP